MHLSQLCLRDSVLHCKRQSPGRRNLQQWCVFYAGPAALCIWGILHGRRLCSSGRSWGRLPRQQSVCQWELLQRHLLCHGPNGMQWRLRVSHHQQLELWKLRAILRDRFQLFGRVLLSQRRPILHDGQPMFDRHVQHLLRGCRWGYLRKQRLCPTVRHHSTDGLR